MAGPGSAPPMHRAVGRLLVGEGRIVVAGLGAEQLSVGGELRRDPLHHHGRAANPDHQDRHPDLRGLPHRVRPHLPPATRQDELRLGPQFEGCACGGPLLPEVYHRYGEGPGGAVIPDGLLHYATGGPGRTLNRAFVEVDRGTMASEKLAAKLIGYARFRDHHPVPAHLRRTVRGESVLPAWQQHYIVFPRLLFVLADTGERAARQRIRDLQSISDSPLCLSLCPACRWWVAVVLGDGADGGALPCRELWRGGVELDVDGERLAGEVTALLQDLDRGGGEGLGDGQAEQPVRPGWVVTARRVGAQGPGRVGLGTASRRAAPYRVHRAAVAAHDPPAGHCTASAGSWPLASDSTPSGYLGL
ncbi:replication-relaxation family protein [Kitasatospora sp. NPDC090091]|uniref:replication-relaxation family protein n=1 Tax=Kitasatospora sp. NPDC090091 TaxID=3364081 RepID=UPI003820182B